MFFIRLRKKKRIAELVPGKTATIQGVVQSEGHLTIPPSGTPCVYYSLMEERFGKGARGRGRSLWFPEKFEVRCAEFSIADDTGVVRVTESGERMKLTGLHREAGLVKGNKRRRFFADFLRPGDLIIARGQVHRESTDSPVVLSAPPTTPLKIVVVRRKA